MIQRVTTAAIFLTLFAGVSLAQENPFTKNFKLFKDVAPGVDFYASNQSDIEPFIRPVSGVRKEIASYLGIDLTKGAIFVCSTVAQNDSVYDVRAFKLGYKWYLIQLTPEAQREQRQARQQAMAAQAAQAGQSGDQAGKGGQGGQRSGQAQTGQRGGQDQTGQRGGQDQSGRGGQRGGPGGQSADMRAAQMARAATSIATSVGYASVMTTLDPNKPYRVSRLDDMSRSPLVDWLDIGLVAHATGNWAANLKFLQDHLDETFALDDELAMNRPFVAQQMDSSGGGGAGGGGRGGDPGAAQAMGGGGNPGVTAMGGGSGQAGGGGRGGAGAARVLPKDQQDRLLFDAQAATFFAYLIEKAGADKAKNVIQQNMKGTEALTVVQSYLGSDIEKVEQDWQTWVKAQKPPENIRNINAPNN
jgi:hypothetical protein